MLNCDSYAHLTVNDWLHLDFRPHLQVQLLIAPWEQRLLIYRCDPADGDRWSALHGVDPGLLLIAPEPRGAVIERFLAPIPTALREPLSRFGYRQFPMLRWLALLAEARSLFEHHPVLFWLVVDLAQEQAWDWHTMRQWLRRPLPELLKATVGVDSRAALRFLAKLVVVNGDRRELEVLRRVLRSTPALNVCRHFDTVAFPLLRVIERYLDLCDYRVLAELNELSHQNTYVRMLRVAWSYKRMLFDLKLLGDTLSINGYARLIHRCRTLAEMQRYHDRWTEQLNRRRNLLPTDTLQVFPAPPLPDSPTIRAIRNTDELRTEGRTLEHCVGSYATRVMRGECSIYQVLEPERGTLALLRYGKTLRINQFRLARNREPSAVSWAAVEEWINQHEPNARLIRQSGELLRIYLNTDRR